ncbi:hypothetical protein SCALM49S_04264 [Streptomyces californicus]
MAVAGAGGGRVLGRAADRAGLARDETGGQLGRDAPQSALPQVQPGLPGVQLLFAGAGQPVLRLPYVGGERVTAVCRVQTAAGRGEKSGELLGAGGGLLRGVDALLEGRTGGVPVGEPRVRVADQLVVGPGLPVQAKALPVDFGAALLGLPCRVEGVQLLLERPFQLGQPVGARVTQLRGQQRPGPVETVARGPVRPLGLLAQLQRRGDPVGPAGALQPLLAGVVFAPPLLQGLGTPQCLRVPLLEPGQFAFGLQRRRAARWRSSAAASAAWAVSSRSRAVERAIAAHANTASARPGSPGRAVTGAASTPAGPAAWALGEGEDAFVGGGDLGLGAPAQFGEALLDGGEAAGVEEPRGAGRSSSASARRKRAKSPCGHSATWQNWSRLMPMSWVSSSPISWCDLLRACQPALGVVSAQPALRLLHGEALAPLLGARLGGAPGDFQAAAADGEFELDLGRQAGGRVVAAQGRAGALAGAGDRSVEGEADGVQDGGLARAGGPVEEEEAGGGEGVEVDFLGGAERAEGRDAQAVQSHRDTSRTVPSTRTSSNAARSTVRSRSFGPLPPRTWATKSSAIWWSSRPFSRWA